MKSRFVSLVCLAMLLAFAVCTVQAGSKFNKKVEVGQKAPEWKDLFGTDDKTHSLSDLKDAKFVVVTFTCNHCPIAAAYEDRFMALARDYKAKGLEFVAISCSKLEQDGFDEMKARAKEKNYPFPYLHDADQAVGRSYGASATPQLFLLDSERKIAYMGAFDDNFVIDEVKHHYLVDAIEAILAGKQPEVTESRAQGCAIEYERQSSKK